MKAGGVWVLCERCLYQYLVPVDGWYEHLTFDPKPTDLKSELNLSKWYFRAITRLE